MKEPPPPTSYYAGLAGLKTEGQPYTHDEDLVRDCPEVDLRAEVKRLRKLVEAAELEHAEERAKHALTLGAYDDASAKIRQMAEEHYCLHALLAERAQIIEDQAAERGELISALHAQEVETARLRSMLETRNRLKLDVCPTCGEIGEAVYYLGLYDDMEKEVIRLRSLIEEAYPPSASV